MKQYAASPVIQQLIADRDSYFPNSWQDDFYNNIWNVDTAQGVGLDIWGRIVVIGRNIQVPSTTYFGFHVTPTETFSSFGQDSFYTGVAATNTVTLADNAYRVLILAKALSNIVQTDAKDINRVINQLFPGRGRAWVNDLGSMSMRFTFEFALEPWELAVLVSGGVLPRPAGVLAQILQLPTDTFGFAEQGIGPVVANGTPMVYRQDWQGSQLLYTTPRTNQFTFSSDFGNASWGKVSATIISSIIQSPDSLGFMQKIVESASNSTHRITKSGLNIGFPWTVSFFAKAAERDQISIGGTNIPSNGGGLAIFDLTNGIVLSNTIIGSNAYISQLQNNVYMCSVSFPNTLAANQNAFCGIAVGGVVSYLGDGSSGAYIWGAQLESGIIPTGYIATSGSTATVTDYSATPSLVTLSSPLLPGATLSWSGTYTSTLDGSTITQTQAHMGGGNGTVSIYPFSGKFSGSGPQSFNQGTFLSNGAVSNAN